MKGERNRLRREKMPLTEAQKRAKAKYNLKITKVSVEFSSNNPSDVELLAKLQTQPNKQRYIKDLIKKDLE